MDVGKYHSATSSAIWSLVVVAMFAGTLYWASDGCFYVTSPYNWLAIPICWIFFFQFLAANNRGKLKSLGLLAVVAFVWVSIFQEINSVPKLETQAVMKLRELQLSRRASPSSKQVVLAVDNNYTFTFIPQGRGYRIEVLPNPGCCFTLRAFTAFESGDIRWAYPRRPATKEDPEI